MTGQIRPNPSPIRQAFVLGAGLGTRLKTLTAHRPKPLIPVCGKPLISYAFDHVLALGVDRLVVNTHHCAEVYSRIFPEAAYRETPIQFAHEPVLLETAGGIKNVEPLLKPNGKGETFLVYNGDILSTLPLEKALAHHKASGNEVTLVLRSKESPHHVALGEDGKIVDISNRRGVKTGRLFLFSGIYLVEPAFFARIPAQTKLSVIPIFMQMIEEGAALGGVVVDEGNWWDLGTREQYLEIHRHLKSERIASIPSPEWIAPSAWVASTAQILGATSLGANVAVGENAVLKDCVVWEGATIAAGSVLENCIVTAGAIVSGAHADADL
jgi:NDP-sugar pyrophosphorylase family protein